MFASAMAVTTFVAPGPEVSGRRGTVGGGGAGASAGGGAGWAGRGGARGRGGQDRAAGDTEDVLDAEILQRTHQRLGAGHLLSIDNGLLVSGRVGFRHTTECLQRRG